MRNLRIVTLALLALVMSVLLGACAGPGSNNVVPGAEGTHALVVVVEGPGTVVINSIDFSCSDECTARIGAGVEVELLAQPDDGNGFVGWQEGCSGSGSCSVLMNDDVNVAAVFAENVLSLQRDGDGEGTVRIVPPDVTCSDDCTQAYTQTLSVSLTVENLEDGTSVRAWGGECSGNGTSRQCVINVEGQTNVTLTLAHPPVANPDSYSTDEDQTLGVNAANGVLSNDSDNGSLSAQLVSGPSNGDLDFNSNGSFTYRPDAGASGEDSFTYRARDSSGNLSNTAEVSITVRRLPRHTLTVDKSGTGSGTVESDPSGIDCGSDCDDQYKEGTSVTLTASAGPNSSFAGWSGDCSGSDETCTVTVNEAKGVTASFELDLFPLSYTKEGAGEGTVTLQPPGRECSDDCRESYNIGESVTLTVVEAEESTFVGWGGECSGRGTCQVTMDGPVSVSAQFDEVPIQHAVSLILDGSGSGTVNIRPPDIDCTSNCTEDIDEGQDVTLTATEASGSSFSGWNGDCSGTDNTCTFTMDDDKNVIATFSEEPPPPTENNLDVDVSGEGTVTSDPGGIDCPDECDADYEEDTEVTLTADPGEESDFEGWNGDCSGIDPTCTVRMDSDRNVTATFSEVMAQFALVVDVEGDGIVASDPGGIDCPDECDADYEEDTEVTLTADPGEESDFEGWSGDCDEESNGSCTVTMDGGKNITATFSPLDATFSLDLEFSGDGTGTVAISPSKSGSCDSDCTETYDPDELVTLTAQPDPGNLFDWGGDCSDVTDEGCDLLMDDDRSVAISFNPEEDEEEVDDDSDNGESDSPSEPLTTASISRAGHPLN